ncbi:hypothetical protein [Marinomonas communis]|uniref:Uncharacterized protein n=1 Tax=Marinomonas communis TaxID=28254 RepID=A0A4R6X1K4_9GAMM|nr:hypothetical protein [Marinomonas communis]TDR06288.1 hypothetical protein C8D85_3218 [Marinomonas communis]
MLKDFKGSMIAVSIAIALTGCATTGNNATNSLADEAARSELMIQINSVKQSIDAADTAFEEGKELELNWYASEDFEEAKQALEKAKSYYAEYEANPDEAMDKTGFFSSTTNIEATEENLSIFTAKIASAKATRTLVQTTLTEAFDNREYLKTIDADQHFPDLVKALDKELKDLIDDIADDKTERAIAGQAELVAKQRALEVKTITKVYLTKAQDSFQALNNTNAKQVAPKSFSEASSTLTEALAFVASAPKQLEQIEEKANLSLFYTKRAELIADEVKQLRSLQQKPQEHESYILRIEALLSPIQEALGSKDARNLSFEEQTKALEDFVAQNLSDDETAEKALQETKALLKEKTEYIEFLRSKIATAEQENTASTEETSNTEN